ncbi:MAG: PHP domain-containing protein [Ruminococcus sp.]|nr:PHP domain-containing protein [Ruminococcus sp.]
MSAYCDLHTHSVYSDGTLTPEELVDAAVGAGLSALALTDHNTAAGLEDFARAAQGKPIEAVPGVEFTTADHGQELHILGLFIPPASHKEINQYINRVQILKDESNYKLVSRLREHGYDIRYVDIMEASKGNINRANIAAELLKKGYVGSIDEAFKTLLHKDYGLYEPPERLSAIETISFIRSVGAVAVWAHPYFHVTFDWAEEFLPRAKDAGLQGMETLYSTYDEETTEKAREVCRRFGLCESGGSDFHGANKPHIALGTGMGNLRIPYAFYEKLSALKNA